MTADVLLADIAAQRDLNEVEARSLIDGMRIDVAGIEVRIKIAFHGRAWISLGYQTWDAMCEAEFDGARLRIPREDRAEQVQSLRAAGLSTRAIGSALGMSEATVRRDLPTASSDAVETVRSLDGRTRPASQPARPTTPSPAATPAGPTVTEPAPSTAHAAPPAAAEGQTSPPAAASTPAAGGEPDNGHAPISEHPDYQGEQHPLTRARAEVAAQPAMVATTGIDYLRRARKAFTAAGTAAAIVADLDNDQVVDRTGDWLHELDAVMPVLTDLTALLRRRNLRSVKP